MLALLRVSAAKLARHGAATLRERLVGLAELLGREGGVEEVKSALLGGFAETLGWTFSVEAPSAGEEEAAARIFAEEIGTEAFVFEPDLPEQEGVGQGGRWRSALRERPGGRIRAALALDHRGIIRDVVLSGDFFLTPPRFVHDLEAALRGVPAAEAVRQVAEMFASRRPTLLGLEAADFIAVIGAALATPAIRGREAEEARETPGVSR